MNRRVRCCNEIAVIGFNSELLKLQDIVLNALCGIVCYKGWNISNWRSFIYRHFIWHQCRCRDSACTYRRSHKKRCRRKQLQARLYFPNCARTSRSVEVTSGDRDGGSQCVPTGSICVPCKKVWKFKKRAFRLFLSLLECSRVKKEQKFANLSHQGH